MAGRASVFRVWTLGRSKKAGEGGGLQSSCDGPMQQTSGVGQGGGGVRYGVGGEDHRNVKTTIVKWIIYDPSSFQNLAHKKSPKPVMVVESCKPSVLAAPTFLPPSMVPNDAPNASDLSEEFSDPAFLRYGSWIHDEVLPSVFDALGFQYDKNRPPPSADTRVSLPAASSSTSNANLATLSVGTVRNDEFRITNQYPFAG